MSAYVKSIDPAHLVMVSSWGYFGRSTPELQPQNPSDLTWRGIGNNAGVCTRCTKTSDVHNTGGLASRCLSCSRGSPPGLAWLWQRMLG